MQDHKTIDTNRLEIVFHKKLSHILYVGQLCVQHQSIIISSDNICKSHSRNFPYYLSSLFVIKIIMANNTVRFLYIYSRQWMISMTYDL